MDSLTRSITGTVDSASNASIYNTDADIVIDVSALLQRNASDEGRYCLPWSSTVRGLPNATGDRVTIDEEWCDASM